MIPPDVANSLRTLLPDQQAAALAPKNQPVVAAQRIADVLSNLVPGQRILAEVQAMLPNGTYRATVAQRDVTLALPFAAKPGDSLELEVTESEGRLTLAFVANRGEAAQQAKGQQPGSAATTLSQTGKLINDLMQEVAAEGKKAPPAALNSNQALVSSMPKNAAELAPVLKQALTQSGMFYEAHQARWVAGQLPTEQLRQEPQGRLPAPMLPLPTTTQPANTGTSAGAAFNATLPMAFARPGETSLAQPLPGSTPATPQPTSQPPTGSTALVYDAALLRGNQAPEAAPTPAATSPNPLTTDAAAPAKDTPQAGNNPAPGANAAADKASAPPPGSGIPRDIAPLVQQQLDGLANQNFAWQGQVWPGQKMWWEIGENPENERKVGEEAGARWRTRLKLDLPVLGGVEARIFLQADNQLSLRLLTDTPESETQLRNNLAALERQFGAAGLQLRQVRVDHEPDAEA